MNTKQYTDVYIASCVQDGGILRYRLGRDGSFDFIDKFDLPTPNYMVSDGSAVYVTLQTPFEGSSESGIVKLRLSEDGTLSRDGEIYPTGGRSSCHLAFSGDDVYVANYSTGSVTKLGNPPLCHEGRGVNPVRQEAPHCHCTFFSPDKKYVLVCDLGLDTVFVYDRELREVSRAKVPDGEGCRHLVFSRDGKFVYVVNELGCSVSTFAYEEGRLTYLSTLPTRTYKEHEGPDKGSAIKLSASGKLLFITNRGEDEVVTLRIKRKGKVLKVISRVDTEGTEPRDFSLLHSERFGLVTNQFSDSVVLYRVSKFPFWRLRRVRKLDIPAPLCVMEI